MSKFDGRHMRRNAHAVLLMAAQKISGRSTAIRGIARAKNEARKFKNIQGGRNA
jgi:hypothetical protein